MSTEHAARAAQLASVIHSPSCAYANFCQVTSTPEELILDFGVTLGSSTAPQSAAPRQRVVLQYSVAKKLATSLAQVIDRHEQLFGQLETDVARRVVPGLHPPDQW